MTVIIDIYGEPCAGKSTLAAGLFYTMKRHYISVELVTEFAKDLVYEESDMDQMQIYKEQFRRVKRLTGKVDYIISDSPLMLGAYYSQKVNEIEVRDAIIARIEELNVSHINYFLKRNHPYDKSGRHQNEDQALEIRHELVKFLNNHRIGYKDVVAADELPGYIYYDLFVDGGIDNVLADKVLQETRTPLINC